MKIKIKVIPKSSINSLEQLKNGELRARITDPPEKGKANRTLIRLLSRHFGVAKSRIFFICGEKASHKTVEIMD